MESRTWTIENLLALPVCERPSVRALHGKREVAGRVLSGMGTGRVWVEINTGALWVAEPFDAAAVLAALNCPLARPLVFPL